MSKSRKMRGTRDTGEVHTGFFVGIPECKRSLGRPKRRWEDDIKMDLRDWKAWNGLLWLRIGPGGGGL